MMKMSSVRIVELPQAVNLADNLEREMRGLYDAHAATLFRYVFSIGKEPDVASETVQETFLRYLIARQAGHEIDSPAPWLFRVARNLLTDHVRSQSRNLDLEGVEANGVESSTDLERRFCQAELVARIEERLSPREYECVRLRAAGFRYQEVAEIMGLQIGTVSAMLGRAVTKLQRLAESHREFLP